MNRRPIDTATRSKNRGADDIKSLRQGLEVLRHVTMDRGLSSGELAVAINTSRAAAFRLLRTLCEMKYLLQIGSGHRVRYVPSRRVRELSRGYAASVQVLDVAIPIMIEWTHQHGWPLALSVPDYDHCILRFNTDPTAARALARYRVGARMNALMSASAMVSLAYQPRHVQIAALQQLAHAALPDYAPRRNAAEIEAILKTTRSKGYAVFKPRELREASIAVPVWHERVVMGCLAQRYMLVADNGAAGHQERLSRLRLLSERISSEARSA